MFEQGGAALLSLGTSPVPQIAENGGLAEALALVRPRGNYLNGSEAEMIGVRKGIVNTHSVT